MSRGWKLTIGAVLTLMFLTCAGVPSLLWLNGGGQPNIATDYAEILNRRAAAIPQDDRALPIYLEITKSLESIDFSSIAEPAKLARPGNESMTLLRGFLDQHAGLFPRIHEAASKPGIGFVANRASDADYDIARGTLNRSSAGAGNADTWLLMMNFPYLADARSMARLLSADIKVAATDGNAARVVENVESQLGISRHAAEHDTLINSLVGIAIRMLALHDLGWVLEHTPDLLTEDQLASLERSLAGLDNGGAFQMSFAGERMFMYDTVQRVFTDDGNGNGEVCPDAFYSLESGTYGSASQTAGPSATDRIYTGTARLFSLDRAEVTAVVDELFDRVEYLSARPRPANPPAQTSPLLKQAYEGDDEAISLNYGMKILNTMLPAFGKFVEAADGYNALEDATRVAIAAERFRRANGAWPEDVEQLVPRYLPAAFRDPFADGPLRIKATDDGLMVYSIGADRDDDGGRHGELARRWIDPAEAGSIQQGDAAEGDWVLVPEPETE